MEANDHPGSLVDSPVTSGSTDVRIADQEPEVDKYGFTGGKQYTVHSVTDISSIETVRKREAKWLAMIADWNRWMSRKFSKIKKRCRKGIPSSLRGKVWPLLCRSMDLKEKSQLTFYSLAQQEISDVIVDEISKDLHRQFPFHEMFNDQDGTGQQDLRAVLHAYAAFNSADGYCQAQAPIAAVLLMHMPAEDAFWCMAAIFQNYIPGYFSSGLETVQVDALIMQSLLKKVCPSAHAHLEKQHINPMLYCTEWFMCIFARTLPWPSVLRLWDMFLCEGIKVVFQCALVLLRTALGNPAVLKSCTGMYETLERIKHLDKEHLLPDVLVREIVSLKMSKSDFEKEHKRQKKLWEMKKVAK